MIMKCKGNCQHDFQDEKYKGKRVFNKTLKKQGEAPIYRCTVCTNEQTAD